MRIAISACVFWCLAAASLANTFRAEGPVVVVNEVPVMTLRGNGAEAQARNVAAALARANTPTDVRAVRNRNNWNIVAGRTLVKAITPAIANAHGSNPAALSQRWVAQIRTAMSLPPVHLPETAVRMAGGMTRNVRVQGSAAARARVESSDDQIVRVTRQAGLLRLEGVGYGVANVVVSHGAIVRSIQVQVLPGAARFPQNLSVSVTGTPSNGSTVQGAVQSAIFTRLEAVPGAEWTFDVPSQNPLLPGESRIVPVRVRAEGPESLPSEGIVNVTVRNEVHPPLREDELWYGNDPEPVGRFGPLFATNLAAGRSARFLYHHINIAPQAMLFRAKIVNTGDRPARVQIIPGDSAPNRNPVLAGVQAGEQFVRNWLTSSSEIVVVPPGQGIPISLRRFAPQETVSGLCSLRLLEGGPEQVLVRADALPVFGVDGRWRLALASSTPWRIVGSQKVPVGEDQSLPMSDHVYPNPFRTENVNFAVGRAHGFVRLGQVPIDRSDRQSVLQGNFGVSYTISASMENPTTNPTDVEIVFEASAGYSGGIFVVNGQVMRTPMLLPKEMARLYRVRLNPGDSRRVSILTVPLSGSSYPATLKIRPVDTLAAVHVRSVSGD